MIDENQRQCPNEEFSAGTVLNNNQGSQWKHVAVLGTLMTSCLRSCAGDAQGSDTGSLLLIHFV